MRPGQLLVSASAEQPEQFLATPSVGECGHLIIHEHKTDSETVLQQRGHQGYREAALLLGSRPPLF